MDITPRATLRPPLPPARFGAPSGWARFSIAEMLHEDRGPSPLGPMTPNDYDDISPITRGEWGFLMGDQGGRQVDVTTC